MVGTCAITFPTRPNGCIFNDATRPISCASVLVPSILKERERPLNAVDFDVDHYAVSSGNPARIVGFRIDFAEWRATLPERLKAVADALAMGDGTLEVARRFGLSPGRISQIRRELEACYREMMQR